MKKKTMVLGILGALLLLLVVLPSVNASPISITDVQASWKEHGVFEDRYIFSSIDITVENTVSSKIYKDWIPAIKIRVNVKMEG